MVLAQLKIALRAEQLPLNHLITSLLIPKSNPTLSILPAQAQAALARLGQRLRAYRVQRSWTLAANTGNILIARRCTARSFDLCK